MSIWLNYHHLFYFWTFIREGSLKKASEKLRLSESSISSQIQKLEEALGETLLERAGRKRIPTLRGRMVLDYADEIFELGSELVLKLKQKSESWAPALRVGVSDALPKILVHDLFWPLLKHPVARVVFYENRPEELFARLSVNELDLALSDVPLVPALKIRAYNHRLGDCGMSILGEKKAVQKAKMGFPASLHQKPFLLPVQENALRRQIDRWFEANEIMPTLLAEFEDSALIKIFAQEGAGFFFAPSILEKTICSQYQVSVLARIKEIREEFYLVSPERKLKSPFLLELLENAKRVMKSAED